MRNSLTALTMFLVLSITGFAQNIFIPDVNFKNALLSNAEINTNSDQEISQEEALLVEALDVRSKGIVSFEGIESFLNLKRFNCSFNKITALDLTSNSKLETLYFGGTNLVQLDLTKNTNLQVIQCYNGKLTSLDLSKNTNLKQLFCGFNLLAVLDLSNNINLEVIECQQNQLVSIYLGDHNSLKYIETISNPNLSTICVSDVDRFTKNVIWKNGKDVPTAISTCLVTSVEESLIAHSFNVHPNPASDFTSIEFTGGGTYFVELISPSGVVLKRFDATLSKVDIDVSNLISGVYYIHVIGSDLNETRKIVVNK